MLQVVQQSLRGLKHCRLNDARTVMGSSSKLLHNVKGTLRSKLTLGFFSWPKSLYYCDLSLTNCTFVKLELGVQGTCFYGDAGEFDRHRGINLGIWCQCLYGDELDGGVV